ncbi:MAG: DUF3995 domain-containing protein [Caulobacterales bacterium]|nr:DUF3995 domain-containing protein [Caulobacterales bacterium]
MIIVAPLVIIVLLAIAGLHLAWGLDLRWPVADEAGLAATVIGIKGVTRMPELIPCLVVAAALLTVAALAWQQMRTPSLLGQLALFAAATVFLLRGVAVWTPFWRALTPQQPFARLDVVLYGLLCIALGAGLVFIALRARA